MYWFIMAPYKSPSFVRGSPSIFTTLWITFWFKDQFALLWSSRKLTNWTNRTSSQDPRSKFFFGSSWSQDFLLDSLLPDLDPRKHPQHQTQLAPGSGASDLVARHLVKVTELRSHYPSIYLSIWSNYSNLTRPHPKWRFSKGNHLISGKSRLVKYYESIHLGQLSETNIMEQLSDACCVLPNL